MSAVRWGVRPSNGTDGDFQRADTCDHCRRDHAWHINPDGSAESCPIIMDALAGEHSYPNEEGPPQWGRDERGVYVCSEYDGPCSCGDHRLPEFKALSSATALPGLRDEFGDGSAYPATPPVPTPRESKEQ